MRDAVTASSAPADPVTRALPYLTFFLTGIVTTLLGPILPWLATRLSLADAEAGAFFTMQFAASLVAGFASGLVVERLGERRTIGLGLACMAAGTAAVTSGTTGAALGGVGLSGVGIGLTVPTTNMLVARAFSSAASAALSALNLAWGAGAAVWPLAVALVGAGRPVLFVVAIVLSVTAAVALGTRQPDLASRSHPARDGRSAVLSWQWWFFAAFFFLYGGSEAAVGGWMTELARRLDPHAPAAIAAAAFWGGLTGGRAAVAVIVGNADEARAALVGAVLAILAVSALIVVRDAPTAIVAGAAAGFGLAPLFPITVAALSRRRASRGAGPLISMSSVGGAILPWLVGFASTRTGSLQRGLLVPLVGCITIGLLHGLFWFQPRNRDAT